MADEAALQLVPAADELWRVQDWRLAELLRAGYDLSTASAISLRVDVDLHQAIDLLEAGCHPETAARILL